MTASRPFKLAAPRVREAAIQGQIIDYLRAEQLRRRVAWFARVNGGLASYGKWRVANYRLYLRGMEPAGKGLADLVGQTAAGTCFCFEVKAPGERPTPEQAAFLAAVRAGGGIALVAFGWEDVRDALSAPPKTPQTAVLSALEGS
jgi:hypothetical protein